MATIETKKTKVDMDSISLAFFLLLIPCIMKKVKGPKAISKNTPEYISTIYPMRSEDRANVVIP